MIASKTMPGARNHYTMRIQSTTRNLSAVREFVQTHAQAAGFSDVAVEQYKLAVDEACTNVIKHAYKGREDGDIEITIAVDPERMTVTIRDQGERFERSTYQEPNLIRSIKERRGGGYGVHLMRRLMDEVEYKVHGPFNEVSLTKFRADNGQGK